MPRGRIDAGALRAAFERALPETFGYVAEDEPVELVNLRLIGDGTAASRLDFEASALDAARARRRERRRASSPSPAACRRSQAPVIARAAMEHGRGRRAR